VARKAEIASFDPEVFLSLTLGDWRMGGLTRLSPVNYEIFKRTALFDDRTG
jgi:hypothetical protein